MSSVKSGKAERIEGIDLGAITWYVSLTRRKEKRVTCVITQL